MKNLLLKFIKIRNLIGLISILFYFGYVGMNYYINKGNMYLNLALLVLTIIYLFLYIYSVYIEENKKIKKKSKKIYKNSKKLIGFINACMIIASIFTNQSNSLITIIMAIFTIGLYFFHLFIEVATMFVKHEIKTIKKEVRSKYVSRG